MLGQELTVFHGLDPQFLRDSEVLNVLVALAGDIAGSAHGAFIQDIQVIIGIANPVLQDGEPNGQPAAGGIGMEVIAADGGADLSIAVVVDLGQRDPFTL